MTLELDLALAHGRLQDVHRGIADELRDACMAVALKSRRLVEARQIKKRKIQSGRSIREAVRQ